MQQGKEVDYKIYSLEEATKHFDRPSNLFQTGNLNS